MSLTKEERETVVELQLGKAERFMAQADSMVGQKCWDLAANRYYYACFHAVQALLIANQLSCKTHHGLIGMFNLYFVKPGLVPVETGSGFARMEQLRMLADYNCNYDVSEVEITEIAPIAKDIVSRVRGLIAGRKQG